MFFFSLFVKVSLRFKCSYSRVYFSRMIFKELRFLGNPERFLSPVIFPPYSLLSLSLLPLSPTLFPLPRPYYAGPPPLLQSSIGFLSSPPSSSATFLFPTPCAEIITTKIVLALLYRHSEARLLVSLPICNGFCGIYYT